jgi:hypothetical protein
VTPFRGTIHPSRQLRAVALALFPTALIACGSSGDPVDPVPPSSADTVAIAIGDSVGGELRSASSVIVYRLVPEVPMELALFHDVGNGDVSVTGNQDLIPLFSSRVRAADGTTLLGQRTGRFRVNAGRPVDVRIRVTPGATSDTAAYRLLLYRVNRVPERLDPAYAPGELVAGEDLETSADIDEFSLPARAGETFVAFFDGAGQTSQLVPGSAELWMESAGSPDFAPSISLPLRQGDLEDIASNSVTTLADGTYRVSAAGTGNVARPIPYRFRVRRVNRAPETARVLYAPGDSIRGERLDHIGDIDEFTVVGAPRQQFTIFFTGDTAAWPSVVTLESFGPSAPTVISARGLTLPNPNTGRVTLPESGQLRLRVIGTANTVAERIGYRMYLYPINPAPEGTATTLALGDSVLGEAIDREGDIDDFPLVLPVATRLNVVLRRVDSITNRLSLLVRHAGGQSVASIPPGPPVAGIGRRVLPAGTYSVRLFADDGSLEPLSDRVRGAYTLHAYPIDEGPESAPPMLTSGALVADAIDPLGDRDSLLHDGTAGDVVRLTLAVPGDPEASAISATLQNPAPLNASGWSQLIIATPGHDLAAAELPETRRYTVSVDGGTGTDGQGTRGAYTLRLEPAPVQPESAPATVALGGSVSEALDPFDIDVYRVTGPPNAEIAVVMTLPASAGTYCTELLGSDSPVRLGSVYGNGARNYGSGVVRLPADGAMRASIWATPELWDQQCGVTRTVARRSGPRGTSLYRLDFIAVNRAPEIAAATLAIGDTVRGETLAHAGDIDEFSFTASAGQRLTFRLVALPDFLDALQLRLQVVAPGGGVLTTLIHGSPLAVTLLASGTYLVRVLGVDGRDGVGPYEFAVEP